MPPSSSRALVSQAAEALDRGDLTRAEQAAGAVLAATRDCDALHLLGLVRIRQDRLEEAAALLVEADNIRAGQPRLLLNLGKVLMALARPAKAEAALARGLEARPDAALKAELTAELYAVQRRQHKREAALSTLALEPARFAAERFDLLQELGRHEDALGLMAEMLRRDPADPRLHRHYNGLLHLLGREAEMFLSYDGAPQSAGLLLDKASLLEQAGRSAEARAVCTALLAREPDNLAALLRGAALLADTGGADDALKTLEAASRRKPGEIALKAGIGNAALRGGDAAKAAAMLEAVVATVPHDHNSLARLSTAWRLLGDARDEALMGYDELVQVYDLEPPPGFGGMAEFNAALEEELAGLHPPRREFLGQSLRGGTQTQGHLFGGGHGLVEQLKARIDEAVGRYIAALGEDSRHPLRGRRTNNFAYNGSWSSRLADCGFHVNHIHPMGWISSCYYAGVPGAVADEKARQGWIKFGEPDFDAGLSFRRAIQPRPGRLVLFPSYMWHGTIPFQSAEKRTTIAFDAVPI
jgi:tetratricopeptide (TPR) repeat protein